MIGGGILEISQAQMVEACQEWLDKRWTVDSPVVTGVVVAAEDGQRYGKFTPSTFSLGLKSNKEFVTGSST